MLSDEFEPSCTICGSKANVKKSLKPSRDNFGIRRENPVCEMCRLALERISAREQFQIEFSDFKAVKTSEARQYGGRKEKFFTFPGSSRQKTQPTVKSRVH